MPVRFALGQSEECQHVLSRAPGNQDRVDPGNPRVVLAVRATTLPASVGAKLDLTVEDYAAAHPHDMVKDCGAMHTQCPTP